MIPTKINVKGMTMIKSGLTIRLLRGRSRRPYVLRAVEQKAYLKDFK